MTDRKELVFVLDNVGNWQAAVEQLSGEHEVIVLDAQKDGLKAMSEAMADYDKVSGLLVSN